MKRVKSEFKVGPYEVTIESVVDRESRLHDYGFEKATWHRGVRIMQRYGSDKALELMDERADRALARNDVKRCHRWRDLMAVIHAIENDEPQPTDRVH
ncbi:Long-chain-fatty-acid CoA ligase [Mesorhizobium loti]|nr:Long-chain-fatty-acid CoA ligase [Mesorhizobium loti]